MHTEVEKVGRIFNFKQYQWFDPRGESVFTLKQGREKVDVSYRALLLCAQQGRYTPTGKKVQLKVCQTPRGLATTIEEFGRFVAAISSTKE